MIQTHDAVAAFDGFNVDSSAFAHQYNGDDVFNGTSFLNSWEVAGGSDNADFALDRGRLVHTVDSNNGWIEHDNGSTPWELGTVSWTVETRAHVIATGNSGFNIWGALHGERNVMQIDEQGVSSLGGTTFDSSDNTDGFHTFRLAYDATLDTYHYFRDGMQITPFAGIDQQGSTSQTRLIFGDCCSGFAGPGSIVEYDYFRYDMSGAYSPANAIALKLQINTTTGAATIVNDNGPIEFDLNSYLITSAANSLVVADWTSLQDQDLATDPTPGNANNGDSWEEYDGSDASFLGEAFLLGSSPVAQGGSLSVGDIFDVNLPRDLVFTFSSLQTGVLDGIVEYVIGPEDADFDDDGDVDGADLLTWQRGQGSTGTNSTGDADSSLFVDQLDLLVWQNQFGNPPVPFSTSTTVPEPNTWQLLCVAFGAFIATYSRRRTQARQLSIVRCYPQCWALSLIVLALSMASASADIVSINEPLIAGNEGYAVYRIPGFTVAADGSLLLFAEGRPSGSDPGASGDIDLVAKRSTDGGQTWSSLGVLHASAGFDYSDPRAVLDRNTGRVHLQYTQWPTLCGQACVPTGLGSNSSVIYYQTSDDHGTSWSGPANINAQVKDPAWGSLNTGPGLGIQLKWQDSAPARNGRLLIPAHRRPPAYEGVALYSDDGGTTWTHGSGATPGYADESEVVELTNGDLLWDARRGGSGRNRYISHDGGDTWTQQHSGDIPISAVDSGMLRYSARREGDDRDRILYSAPLGDPAGAGNGRSNIGLWTSYDEGQTFINPVQIQSGSAAYSVIDKLADSTIGLIYEVNHRTIRYVNFDLTTLEGAVHPDALTHYEGFGNQIDAFRGGVGWSDSWSQSNVNVVTGVLSFPGYFTEDDVAHAQLQGSSLSRSLGTNEMQLNENQDYYLSLFVKHDSSDGVNSSSQESLNIQLLDGGNQRFVFGVTSSEAFFVSNDHPSTDVVADAGSLQLDEAYLVLAKIAAQDDSAGNHVDQVFLSWYDDPSAVPTDEAEIDWMLAGMLSQNFSGSIDQITIDGGGNADWRIDGLRIGTTFDAVIVDTDVSPPLIPGDLDGNLVVDLADWVVFRGSMMESTSSLSADEQLRAGDFDQSGLIDLKDFEEFHVLFDAANGNGAFLAAISKVPEPTTAILLVSTCLCILAYKRTRVRLGYSDS